MKLEEIVALSVKHNVSDLHLCNSAAPRWRRQGKLESAPFPAPDIADLLNDWLDAAQFQHWQEHGQIDFALTLACGSRLRASAKRTTGGREWLAAGHRGDGQRQVDYPGGDGRASQPAS